MSRRSQSKRRRSYGRRQHELRERRPTERGADWLGAADVDIEAHWSPADAADDRQVFGDPISGFNQ